MDQAPPNPANVNQPLSLPDTWPGAVGIYKYSAQAVKTNLGAIILLGLGAIAVALGVSVIVALLHIPRGLGTLINDLLEVWLSVALTIVYLSSVRSVKITPEQALKQGQKFYLNFLLASIIVGLLTGISFLLLVIPVFFVYPRLVLTSYFVVDRGLGAVDAVKASWNSTKGHSGKVWGITLLAIGMAVLCIVLIGIYFLLMYSAAMALLYVFVTGHPAAVAQPPVAAVPPAAPTMTPPVVTPPAPTA